MKIAFILLSGLKRFCQQITTQEVPTITANTDPSNYSKKDEESKTRYCGLPVIPDRKLDDNIDPNR